MPQHHLRQSEWDRNNHNNNVTMNVNICVLWIIVSTYSFTFNFRIIFLVRYCFIIGRNKFVAVYCLAGSSFDDNSNNFDDSSNIFDNTSSENRFCSNWMSSQTYSSLDDDLWQACWVLIFSSIALTAFSLWSSICFPDQYVELLTKKEMNGWSENERMESPNWNVNSLWSNFWTWKIILLRLQRPINRRINWLADIIINCLADIRVHCFISTGNETLYFFPFFVVLDVNGVLPLDTAWAHVVPPILSHLNLAIIHSTNLMPRTFACMTCNPLKCPYLMKLLPL